MLTAQQRRFVREYLVDLNGTQAAIRAGYRPKGAHVRASTLLAKPEIAALVAKGTKQHAEQAGVDAGRVLDELQRVAFATVDTPRAGDKVRALELLMKRLGLFHERLDVKVDLSRLDDGQLQALELLRRGGVI